MFDKMHEFISQHIILIDDILKSVSIMIAWFALAVAALILPCHQLNIGYIWIFIILGLMPYLVLYNNIFRGYFGEQLSEERTKLFQKQGYENP